MKSTRSLVDNGKLTVIRADGCARDYDSHLPHYKPMMFVTDMEAAIDTLGQYRCNHDHNRQSLEGNNTRGSRTRQAAEWPETLDTIILGIIEQQIQIDSARVAHDDETNEAFNTQAIARRKRRRQVPPSTPLPAPVPQGDRSDAVRGDPEEVPSDPELQRLQASAGLNPKISSEERQRRKLWSEVPADIRRELRRMRVNLGHISSVGLLRRLRRANARPEVIAAVNFMPCDACGDAIRQLHPRPTRLPGKFVFNYLVWIDVLTTYDCVGNSYHFTNILCEGTGFGVIYCIQDALGIPASKIVLFYLTLLWTSWAGWPHVIRVDRGKEFISEFADACCQHAVELDGIPFESPWQIGKAERRGGL